ncbi:Hint domain-containing protein [Leisingera sp. S232]|uniref:Hint domain-containing protein n=1 Tax=Leisingera sp. S232 TaxID=3415132 RepID=UPI003C7DB8E6
MPIGYLVTLGDGVLDVGDSITASQVSITSVGEIGTGDWNWSGILEDDGLFYNNISDTGVYHLADDGNVYFVPDLWDITSGTATVETIPGSVIAGTAGNDSLDGSGADDAIFGGDGADTLNGASGDTLFGGIGDDQLSVTAAAAAPVGGTVVNDGGWGSGGYGQDSFEWAPGTSGTGTIDLGGTPGTTGSDDVSDTITVSNTNDGAYLTTLKFDVGIDQVFLTETPTSIVNTNASSGVSDFTVTYANGNSQTFRFYNDGAGVSDPAQFFATLPSSGGATLDGGDGNDTLTGGADADLLTGGSGADSISGNSGSDTIDGGTGDDLIDLGSDSDRDYLIVDVAGGSDTIYGFDLSDSGDGTTVDQFDVSDLTGPGGAVNVWDITVSDTNGDGTGDAILTFPGGESVTLDGVLASQVNEVPELLSMGFVCFAKGTRIAAPGGSRLVEDIEPGDYVTTADKGIRQVRWVASSSFDGGAEDLPQNLVPVRIKPGSLGNSRPLLLSQQHCILMRHRGRRETVFVRAKHLAEETGLASFAKGRKQVSYYHLLTAQHEVLISNDVAAESFYPGPQAVSLLRPQDRRSLKAILPRLEAEPVEAAYGPRARPVLTRKQVAQAYRAGELEAAPPRRSFGGLSAFERPMRLWHWPVLGVTSYQKNDCNVAAAGPSSTRSLCSGSAQL